MTRTLTRIGATRPKMWKLSLLYISFRSNIHARVYLCAYRSPRYGILCKYLVNTLIHTNSNARAFCNNSFVTDNKKIILLCGSHHFIHHWHFAVFVTLLYKDSPEIYRQVRMNYSFYNKQFLCLLFNLKISDGFMLNMDLC